MAIPVVDVFAGPGGLAEGFANLRARDGRNAFDVVLSVEKERHAHATLTLRKLVRSVGQPAVRLLAAGAPVEAVFGAFPEAYAYASRTALRLDLGPQTQDAVAAARMRIGRSGPWVLIGGPPCQAYSLVGRARRRRMVDYVPEQDERQTLYLEYLQLLADCEPAAFVMENVKGLLSAVFAAQRLFERIADDLANPAGALRREGRRSKAAPRYRLLAFGVAGLRASDESCDYVVRAEQYGVPQARHRVIIIGLRDDCCMPGAIAQHRTKPIVTVREALEDLPKVRSGISRQVDTCAEWRRFVQSLSTREWRKALPVEVQDEMDRAASRVVVPLMNRGAEVMLLEPSGYVFNHTTRAHIPSDLERYFFAASYSRVLGRSPDLRDFPPALLPEHSNVKQSLESGTFMDRFRVQLSDAPASTITSHIAKDGHYYIHYDPTQCRSLTVREAARLQTFPDDYVFTGPRTAQYAQVGNAVPPLLAQQIAAAVHTLIT